jgi:hypothetical protein
MLVATENKLFLLLLLFNIIYLYSSVEKLSNFLSKISLKDFLVKTIKKTDLFVYSDRSQESNHTYVCT